MRILRIRIRIANMADDFWYSPFSVTRWPPEVCVGALKLFMVFRKKYRKLIISIISLWKLKIYVVIRNIFMMMIWIPKMDIYIISPFCLTENTPRRFRETNPDVQIRILVLQAQIQVLWHFSIILDILKCWMDDHNM